MKTVKGHASVPRKRLSPPDISDVGGHMECMLADEGRMLKGNRIHKRQQEEQRGQIEERNEPGHSVTVL